MAENEETQESAKDPEAIAQIAGKSRENAVRALAAADEAGVQQWRVRTTANGFEAPNAVVDIYNRMLEEEAAEAVALAELEAKEAAEAQAAGASPDEAAPASSDTPLASPPAPESDDLPADNDDWTHKRLDDFASNHKPEPIELAKGLNKTDKVAAILAALNKE